MDKAKRFQPLAVLNQKLKGLDVFESNENSQSFAAPRRPSASYQPISDHPSIPRVPDAEDVVAKDHWQPRTFNDNCLEPSCGKRLNATNGCVNCRKCGKLFCEEHTMYQMKLSRSAQHEPVRGLWCRVCETCYKSREGYNDHNGEQTHFLGVLKGELSISYRSGKGPNRYLQSREEAHGRQGRSGNVSARETPDTAYSSAGQSSVGTDSVGCQQALVDFVAERST